MHDIANDNFAVINHDANAVINHDNYDDFMKFCFRHG